MRELSGDIWDFHDEGRWVVITTNIGWKKDGSNPMGAGLAKRASSIYEDLPHWYGRRCKKYLSNTSVCLYRPGKLIMFPTKALDEDKPWMSWKQDSSIDLIRRSTKQLPVLVDRCKLFGDIGVPLVGCQNGNLPRRSVLPILHKYLDDRFVLIDRL